MFKIAAALSGVRHVRSLPLLAAIGASLMLGACAGQQQPESASLANPFATASLPEDAGAGDSKKPQTELQKAVEYWGKEFSKKPTDAKAGLAYAKNLKAMGEKDRALVVLQQAANSNPEDKEIASEYGRLALDQGQVALAQRLLAMADDPSRPDWRVISAQGTAFAKQGKQKEAIPYFERARAIAPTQISVLNNLALAYAMDGQAEKAEGIFREIPAGQANAKVRQNLALVLGLQGKYEESRQVAAADIAPDQASANARMLKSMTQIEERPSVDPELQRLRQIADATPARSPAKASPSAPQKAVANQVGVPTAAVADASETYWAQVQAKAEAAQARMSQAK